MRTLDFSAAELNLLQEKVQVNLKTINAKFSSSINNAMKASIWASITSDINALGVT